MILFHATVFQVDMQAFMNMYVNIYIYNYMYICIYHVFTYHMFRHIHKVHFLILQSAIC